MYFTNVITTILVSVLFLISSTVAVPVPQDPAGPIPLRWVGSSLYNATITNATLTNSTKPATARYTNTTLPASPYTNVTAHPPAAAHINTTSSYYTNHTTSGSKPASNVTYPWMANSTTSSSHGSSGTGSQKPSSTSHLPITPSTTATFQPFQGGAVSLGKMTGSWTIVIAVIGAMAML